jgi:hypothetical protein
MANELAVLTIADQSHIPGVVGLVESLRANDFDGPICVGAMDSAVAGLQGEDLHPIQLDASEDTFPGNLKPHLILASDCPRFLYLDADIVVTNPRFVERIDNWIDLAPVVAAESLIAPSDYRRHAWEDVSGGSSHERAMVYYNSGMIAGVTSRERGLLRRWKELNETAIDPEDGHYSNEAFPMPDQDTLNSLLQKRDSGEIVSVQPPDWWNAAASSNSFFHVGGCDAPVFLHCTTSQKPWLLDAIPPRSPNPYERVWADHVTGESRSVSHEVSLPVGVRRWLGESLDGRLAVKLKQLKDRFFS